MASDKMIKLNGVLIEPDGTEKKTGFFKFLEIQEDDYSDVAFTAKEAAKIKRHLSGLSTGSCAAVPIYCGGPAICPFARSCPFCRIDKERKKENSKAKMTTPIGKRCPVEINLLNEWTRMYIREYDVEEENFTEFMMVRELAETELMMWRLNNNIAKPENAELVQEAVVGVDAGGNPLTRLEVNAFLEAKEKLQNRKAKIIRLMVGDREGKYKREAALKLKSVDDASTNAAKLRGHLDILLKQAKGLDLKIKQAEGKVIEIKPGEEPVAESPILTPEDLINKE